MKYYKVKPLEVGICHLGKDHVLGDDYSEDDRISFALYAVLVQGEGVNALVDLGPETLEYTNDMFRKYGFFRKTDGVKEYPDDLVQKNGNVFDRLRDEGVAPEEIDYLIFSHLHADHHGMDNAKNPGAAAHFSNAMLIASGRGWQANLDRRVNGQWNSYVDFAFGDYLKDMGEKGKCKFVDDYEVCEGISTIYLGGHSVCSQAIKIATEYGPVVLTSDDIYHYSLLERAIVPRLCTTEDNIKATNRRLAEMVLDEGAILFPLHDPLVAELYEKYGDEWIREARDLSLVAANGFMANSDA